MKWFFSLLCLLTWGANVAHAQYAAEVVSYDAGSNPAAGFLDPSTALGAPERLTGEGVFPAEVTIFNPPWGTDELVSIGKTGHLTLRLSHFAVAHPTQPEIGVFTNAGFVDVDWPNGRVDSPPATFGVDEAEVEVSADGTTWHSLGVITFDIPTQGYSDVAGTVPSNFFEPFTGGLADFDGLPYSDPVNPDVFDLLAGSGGGTWLDISGTPLSEVGYIRFSVADGPLDVNFDLDAVTIAAAAVGARIPEPSALVLIGFAVVGVIRRR